jgi:polyphosphate kinase 2 (PPK2 family)
VLVVRVDKIVASDVWKACYDQINNFEKLLSDNGTTILKFFLHISKKEQRKRFQDRLDDPEKHWKFSREDLEKRKQWDDYMAAYEDVLNRCTTPWAPWYVIPSDQKWYRNLVIARTLVNTIKRLDPRFPPEEPGLDQIVIR